MRIKQKGKNGRSDWKLYSVILIKMYLESNPLKEFQYLSPSTGNSALFLSSNTFLKEIKLLLNFDHGQKVLILL